MVLGAWGLQLLDHFPDAWERIAEQKRDDAVRVAFRQQPPKLDGLADSGYVALGKTDAALHAASDIKNLYVHGASSEDRVTFTVFGEADGQGNRAEVTVFADGTGEARMADGTKVTCSAATHETKDGWTFELRLPYAINKQQARWGTAMETAYLSVKTDGRIQNLFFLSNTERIRTYLEREVGGGLAVWKRVFDEIGYIPTAFHYGRTIREDMGSHNWFDGASDLGGYAHLLTAAAEYLLYKQGRPDWEFFQDAAESKQASK
jgi:hypothetical protein